MSLPGLYFAWVGFAASFTAPHAAWWNSIGWFVAFVATAGLLAIFSLRSVLGIIALVLSLLPLGLC